MEIGEEIDRSMVTSKCPFKLRKATFHPPALPPDDDGDAEIPWVLLDEHAYVAERHNATTAVSTTWNGKRIQVTFCLARPPSVSYFCVFCPEAEIPMEPKILATEDDIVLIRILVSSRRDFLKDDDDYYVYEANAAAGPSLNRLPRPPSPYGFDSDQVGILRYRTDHGQRRSILRAHRDDTADFYLIAGLCMERDPEPGQFPLCVYNSKQPGAWSVHTVSLDEQLRLQYGYRFLHVNSKVISIGGDNGDDIKIFGYKFSGNKLPRLHDRHDFGFYKGESDAIWRD